MHMNEEERYELTNRIEDVFETEGDLLYVVTALYDRYYDMYGKTPIRKFKLQYNEEEFCHQCGVKLNG